VETNNPYVRLMPVYVDEKLLTSIEDLRGKERPILPRSTMARRLIELGMQALQQGRGGLMPASPKMKPAPVTSGSRPIRRRINSWHVQYTCPPPLDAITFSPRPSQPLNGTGGHSPTGLRLRSSKAGAPAL
jgi:hypothetical protein